MFLQTNRDGLRPHINPYIQQNRIVSRINSLSTPTDSIFYSVAIWKCHYPSTSSIINSFFFSCVEWKKEIQQCKAFAMTQLVTMAGIQRFHFSSNSFGLLWALPLCVCVRVRFVSFLFAYDYILKWLQLHRSRHTISIYVIGENKHQWETQAL